MKENSTSESLRVVFRKCARLEPRFCKPLGVRSGLNRGSQASGRCHAGETQALLKRPAGVPKNRGRTSIWQARQACGLALIVAIVLAGAAPPPARGSDSPLTKAAAAKFPNLTRAERALLDFADVDNISRGPYASADPSANPDAPANDPAHADKWDAQRDVRAALIEWMCEDPRAIRLISPNGIGLIGARIVGQLMAPSRAACSSGPSGTATSRC